MNTTRFAELRVLEDMIVLVRLQLQELARTHGRSRLYHGTNQPLFELAVGRHTALVGPTWNCRDRVLLRYAGWSLFGERPQCDDRCHIYHEAGAGARLAWFGPPCTPVGAQARTYALQPER